MKHLILLLAMILAFSSCSKEGDDPFVPPIKQCNDRLYAHPLPADTCLDFPDLWGPTYIYHRVGLGYAH
ncbi:MAG: hypothetical protein J5I98_29255 [Phaeodactylibacter sp.]|nr:hypothetical protein [Phaeodactylibacter sp.]